MKRLISIIFVLALLPNLACAQGYFQEGFPESKFSKLYSPNGTLLLDGSSNALTLSGDLAIDGLDFSGQANPIIKAGTATLIFRDDAGGTNLLVINDNGTVQVANGPLQTDGVLDVNSDLNFASQTDAEIIGSATSTVFRNNADNADTMRVFDTGDVRVARDVLANTGSFKAEATGQTLHLEDDTGASTCIGSGTLVAGTVTISTTCIGTGDYVFVTRTVEGGTLGYLRYDTIVDGTSFDISSSDGADTSSVNWFIVKQL